MRYPDTEVPRPNARGDAETRTLNLAPALHTPQDDMQCAEDYVRYCCRFLLDNCRADLEFVNKMIDNTAIARLEQVRGRVGLKRLCTL